MKRQASLDGRENTRAIGAAWLASIASRRADQREHRVTHGR
jgi:hypothetical protein